MGLHYPAPAPIYSTRPPVPHPTYSLAPPQAADPPRAAPCPAACSTSSTMGRSSSALPHQPCSSWCGSGWTQVGRQEASRAGMVGSRGKRAVGRQGVYWERPRGEAAVAGRGVEGCRAGAAAGAGVAPQVERGRERGEGAGGGSQGAGSVSVACWRIRSQKAEASCTGASEAMASGPGWAHAGE